MASSLTGIGAFSNGHRWECKDLESGETHEVGGPLAEIMAQYPDYELTYLGHPQSVGERKADYAITHKCGTSFKPEKTVRLKAEHAERKRFKYQDLMMGTCPRCSISVFAWIGVNHLNEPAKYMSIRAQEQMEWINRMLAAQRGALFKLDPNKHSKVRKGTVTGTVRDKLSEKYRYRDVIPVQ